MTAQNLGDAYKRINRLENIVQRQNELFKHLQPIHGYFWSDQNASGKLRRSPCFVANYHEQKVRRGDKMVDAHVADIVAIDNSWAGGLYQSSGVEEFVPDPLVSSDDDKAKELARKNNKFEFVFELPEVLALLADMEKPVSATSLFEKKLEASTDDGEGTSKAS